MKAQNLIKYKNYIYNSGIKKYKAEYKGEWSGEDINNGEKYMFRIGKILVFFNEKDVREYIEKEK